MSIALALNDSNDQQSRASLAKNIMPVGRIRAYLRDLCGLFVIIVDENVYLLHQTARDFLIYIETQDKTEQSALSDNIYKQDDGTRSYIWKHSMNPMDSNSVFAKACILYLHLDFAKEDISLLEYSAIYWLDHYHQSREICQEAVAEMTRDICMPSLRTKWTDIHKNHNWIPETGPPLCLASALGLDRAVEMLLHE
jgi:hypothetical protein